MVRTDSSSGSTHRHLVATRGEPRTDTAVSTPSRRSRPGVRSFVTAHPIASFLVMAYTLLWAAWVPVIALGAPPRLMSTVGALLGLAVPAFVVTWLTEGGEGVRDLARRTLRWRVHVGWYVCSAFVIPAATLLLAALVSGPASLVGPGAAWAGTLSWFLWNLLVALVTVQLAEEIGWTGFAQHRVQARHGGLRGSILVAVAFAFIHLPTYLTAPVTGPQVAQVLAQMVPFVVISVFLRVLLSWTYNRTVFSVLPVALLHASLNTASASEFFSVLGAGGVATMLPIGAVALLATAVAVASRGTLGYPRPLVC